MSLLLLLHACSPAETPEQEDPATGVPLRVQEHYHGADQELWLRSDSLFVLSGSAGSPGRLGRWTVAAGEVVLEGPEGVERFGPAASGLQRLSSGEQFLVRDAGGDATAWPLRVHGTHNAANDSHSFTPCGTDREFPLAVNGHLEALQELRRTAAATPEAPLVITVSARLAPGPAMEGSGEEEYLWLERVEGSRPACP
jgi:hypothetical protein